MSAAFRCRARRCALVHNAICSARNVYLDGSPMGWDHERLQLFFRLPYGVRVGEIMPQTSASHGGCF